MPGRLYNVYWRVYSPGKKADEDWLICPFPKVLDERLHAKNITKQEAERLIDWWSKQENCQMFEFKTEPQP